MAKMEKIRNMQVVDNKQYKFFCFPMISMVCTGSGYTAKTFEVLAFLFAGTSVTSLSKTRTVLRTTTAIGR
ncbi:hypothetical protein [uncultured Alistipes sp.]|uniref:hypothetical protein n=1 Tax=uncultured Alistipes sp. TaxID=538949 RepID=UPI0032B1E6E3